MAEVSSLLAHNDFGPQTSGHSSSGAQHAPGAVVEKDALGVEAVAGGGEAVPFGIALANRACALIVALAPMWAAYSPMIASTAPR